MKKILKKILDIQIVSAEIIVLREEMHQAIKAKKYELLVELRKEEIKLEKKLPKISTVKKLRVELDKIKP